MPLIEKIGGSVLSSGQAAFCLVGDAKWDAMTLVRCPNKEASNGMAQSLECQAIHHHREAGLEGQILYAIIQKPLNETFQ